MCRIFSEQELVTNKKVAGLIQQVKSKGYNDSTKLLSILSEKLTSERKGIGKPQIRNYAPNMIQKRK